MFTIIMLNKAAFKHLSRFRDLFRILFALQTHSVIKWNTVNTPDTSQTDTRVLALYPRSVYQKCNFVLFFLLAPKILLLDF